MRFLEEFNFYLILTLFYANSLIVGRKALTISPLSIQNPPQWQKVFVIFNGLVSAPLNGLSRGYSVQADKQKDRGSPGLSQHG